MAHVAPGQSSGTTTRLACHHCTWQGQLGNQYSCPICGASLEVAYSLIPGRTDWTTAEQGIWRYRYLLPISQDQTPVTLGEGSTTLLEARGLERSGHLLLKNEFCNPTGSFKDRPVAVAMTMALQFGLQAAICASTGNTGVAVAAYAARAGLPAICLVPDATPMPKLLQMAAVGAVIIRVRGTYSDAYALAQQAAEHYGWANVTSTYINPYMLEGDKTAGYEIFEQLGRRAPQWIIVPVGAGPLLAAIYKAFQELKVLGLLERTEPRMVAVQAAGCAPIVRAFEAGADEVSAWDDEVATAASSIADPLRGYSVDGTRTLSVVRQSKGLAIAVSEAEIQASFADLAHTEGLIVESGAAVAVAAYQKLAEQGYIRPDEHVVLLLTGHGLKDIAALQTAAEANVSHTSEAVAPGDVKAVGDIVEKQQWHRST
jgi:threonine synthase